MAIDISSELYNEVAGLKANVGDWVDGTLDFAITVEHRFDETNKMFYSDTTGNNGGIYELEWSQGDWSAEGFSAGDDIELELILEIRCSGILGPDQITKYVATIDYISIDKKTVILKNALALGPGQSTNFPPIPLGTFISKHSFPGTEGASTAQCAPGVFVVYRYGIGSVRKVNRPEEIHFNFNLTPNNSQAQASVLNGQVNTFVHILPTVANFSAQLMQQRNNPSGGYFKNVTIKQHEIIENDFGASLLVFPNPTSGRLKIDLGDRYQLVSVSIRNVSGQLVRSQQFENVQHFHLEIILLR